MEKHELTLEEFKTNWCRRGLNPADYDLVKLHNAWCTLHKLMQRMQTPHRDCNKSGDQAIDSLPESIFDPTCLFDRRDS